MIPTSQYAAPDASNDTTGKKHANVSRAGAYRTPDDEDYASELYCSFSAVSICRPGTYYASDDCASAVHAVEGTDDVGCIRVALFALGCKIEVCVD